MTVLLNNVDVRGASPYMYYTLSYDTKREGPDMYYKFTWRLKLGSSSGWFYNTLRIQINLNGTVVFTHNIDDHSKGWDHTGTTDWFLVEDKTTGTTSCTSTVLDTQNSSWVNYNSGTLNLSVLPAYAEINDFVVYKRDEHSFSYNAVILDTIDMIWTSTDNGETWVEYGTSKTMTGLEPNTEYNCKIKVRRADSQLITESETFKQTTYSYPYVVSTPDFEIGQTLTIDIYNPLSRVVDIYIIGDDDSQGVANRISDTDISGYTSIDYKNFFYNSIPNSSTGIYKVRLVHSDKVDTTVNGGTYRVRGNNLEAPTFNDFNWLDTDSTASKLTNTSGQENPKILIHGLSDIKFTVPSSMKSSSTFGANLDSYTFIWSGGASSSASWSTSDVTSHVYDGTDDKISVTAYDKRGQYKTVTKTGFTILKPTSSYANVSTKRLNGIESTTYLQGSFSIWNGDWAGGESRPNNIIDIKMSVNGESLIDITSDILDNSIVSINGNIKTYIFDDVLIHASAEKTGGFTVGSSYNLMFFISTGINDTILYEHDKLLTTASVSDGKIGMSKYKDNSGNYHYGINGMPDEDYTLIVHGSLKITSLDIEGLSATDITATIIDASEINTGYMTSLNTITSNLTLLDRLLYKGKPVPLKNLHTIDLSAYSSDNWFPIAIDTIENGPPIHIELSSQSLGGNDPYNSNRLVGYISGNGWHDRGEFYDLIATRFAASECTIGAVLYGSRSFVGVIIYVRGGRTYELITRGYVYVIKTNNTRLPNETNGTTLSANTNTITTTNANMVLDFRDKTFTTLKCISHGSILSHNTPVPRIYIQTQTPTSPLPGDIWIS